MNSDSNRNSIINIYPININNDEKFEKNQNKSLRQIPFNTENLVKNKSLKSPIRTDILKKMLNIKKLRHDNNLPIKTFVDNSCIKENNQSNILKKKAVSKNKLKSPYDYLSGEKNNKKIIEKPVKNNNEKIFQAIDSSNKLNIENNHQTKESCLTSSQKVETSKKEDMFWNSTKNCKNLFEKNNLNEINEFTDIINSNYRFQTDFKKKKSRSKSKSKKTAAEINMMISKKFNDDEKIPEIETLINYNNENVYDCKNMKLNSPANDKMDILNVLNFEKDNQNENDKNSESNNINLYYKENNIYINSDSYLLNDSVNEKKSKNIKNCFSEADKELIFPTIIQTKFEDNINNEKVLDDSKSIDLENTKNDAFQFAYYINENPECDKYCNSNINKLKINNDSSTENQEKSKNTFSNKLENYLDENQLDEVSDLEVYYMEYNIYKKEKFEKLFETRKFKDIKEPTIEDIKSIEDEIKKLWYRFIKFYKYEKYFTIDLSDSNYSKYYKDQKTQMQILDFFKNNSIPEFSFEYEFYKELDIALNLNELFKKYNIFKRENYELVSNNLASDIILNNYKVWIIYLKLLKETANLKFKNIVELIDYALNLSNIDVYLLFDFLIVLMHEYPDEEFCQELSIEKFPKEFIALYYDNKALVDEKLANIEDSESQSSSDSRKITDNEEDNINNSKINDFNIKNNIKTDHNKNDDSKNFLNNNIIKNSIDSMDIVDFQENKEETQVGLDKMEKMLLNKNIQKNDIIEILNNNSGEDIQDINIFKNALYNYETCKNKNYLIINNEEVDFTLDEEVIICTKEDQMNTKYEIPKNLNINSKENNFNLDPVNLSFKGKIHFEEFVDNKFDKKKEDLGKIIDIEDDCNSNKSINKNSSKKISKLKNENFLLDLSEQQYFTTEKYSVPMIEKLEENSVTQNEEIQIEQKINKIINSTLSPNFNKIEKDPNELKFLESHNSLKKESKYDDNNFKLVNKRKTIDQYKENIEYYKKICEETDKDFKMLGYEREDKLFEKEEELEQYLFNEFNGKSQEEINDFNFFIYEKTPPKEISVIAEESNESRFTQSYAAESFLKSKPTIKKLQLSIIKSHKQNNFNETSNIPVLNKFLSNKNREIDITKDQISHFTDYIGDIFTQLINNNEKYKKRLDNNTDSELIKDFKHLINEELQINFPKSIIDKSNKNNSETPLEENGFIENINENEFKDKQSYLKSHFTNKTPIKDKNPFYSIETKNISNMKISANNILNNICYKNNEINLSHKKTNNNSIFEKSQQSPFSIRSENNISGKKNLNYHSDFELKNKSRKKSKQRILIPVEEWINKRKIWESKILPVALTNYTGIIHQYQRSNSDAYLIDFNYKNSGIWAVLLIPLIDTEIKKWGEDYMHILVQLTEFTAENKGLASLELNELTNYIKNDSFGNVRNPELTRAIKELEERLYKNHDETAIV